MRRTDKTAILVLTTLCCLLGYSQTGRQTKAEGRGNTPAVTERQAIQQSMALLDKSSHQWLGEIACASCHHQTLQVMTTVAARAKGFKVDDGLADKQRKLIEQDLTGEQAAMLRAISSPHPESAQVGPNPEMIFGYALLGLAELKVERGPLTDTALRYLLPVQEKAGNWKCRVTQRPPFEASDFAATALMIRAAREYAPADQAVAAQRAIASATGWLKTATPQNTEDRTFRLLGLHWAATTPDSVAEAGRDLLAQQRTDGGWAQTGDMQSDAYATGQSLVALYRTGILNGSSPQFRKGIDFLLRTREADGSWHVKSRAKPIQRYFESGFPHGVDQFISYAGSCWATLALLSDSAQ